MRSGPSMAQRSGPCMHVITRQTTYANVFLFAHLTGDAIRDHAADGCQCCRNHARQWVPIRSGVTHSTAVREITHANGDRDRHMIMRSGRPCMTVWSGRPRIAMRSWRPRMPSTTLVDAFREATRVNEVQALRSWTTHGTAVRDHAWWSGRDCVLMRSRHCGPGQLVALRSVTTLVNEARDHHGIPSYDTLSKCDPGKRAFQYDLGTHIGLRSRTTLDNAVRAHARQCGL